MMKKILSAIATTSLVAMMVPAALAAGLVVDSVVHDDIAGTVTVNVAAKDFTADNISSWSVRNSGGAIVTSGNSAEVTEAVGSFVITSPALAGMAPNDNYTVAFTTVANDYSAALFYVGNANQVVVTATVEPTLTMVVAGSTVNLGILNAGAVVENTGTTVTVTTNAQGGATIYAADDLQGGNYGLYSATANKSINAATTVTPGSEAFDILVNINADPEANGQIDGNFDQQVSTNPINGTAQAIGSTTGPTSGFQVAVDYRATISAITPAANDYTTTLTYTATAAF